MFSRWIILQSKAWKLSCSKEYKNNSNVRPKWKHEIKFSTQNNSTWKWNHHSWQYDIKPQDESIVQKKLKGTTMFASKVPLEIIFAWGALNHWDSKKFKNFANKANVMEWVLGLFY